MTRYITDNVKLIPCDQNKKLYLVSFGVLSILDPCSINTRLHFPSEVADLGCFFRKINIGSIFFSEFNYDRGLYEGVVKVVIFGG